MRTLVVVALLLFCAFKLQAQLNPDRHWERLQAKYPALRKLDNTDAKSWVLHAVIVVGVGHLIAVLPGIDTRQGMRAMVGFYLLREAYGVLFQKNRDYVDATMDVVAPLIVVELLVRL